MKGVFLALFGTATCLAQAPPSDRVQLQPLQEVRIPFRTGIDGQTNLSLEEAIRRVLENDPDLQIARIQREEAGYNVTAALGYFDPVMAMQAYRSRAVTPIASLIGGSSNGKLSQTELAAAPAINGYSPWFGGTYGLTFNNSRQENDSTFATLNPQYPTSVTLNLNQPLWRSLRIDEPRYRLQVARKNLQLTSEQLRQRVIEIVTLAVQSYWELDYALQNLEVQTEAVRLAEQQYDSNRRQAEQGLLAPIDVVAAQTQVATFQQNLLAAQRALTAAENNLKAMILANRADALWSKALIPETQLNPDAVTPSLEDAIRGALQSRPELSENMLSQEITNLQLRLNQEAAKPRVDAFATLTSTGLAGAPKALTGFPGFSFGTGTLPPVLVGSYGQSLANITSGNFTTARIGVQVSLPLRNRTAEANVAVSLAEKRRLDTARNQIGMAIEADVRNALEGVNTARARYEAALLASRSAEQQYSSEQRQFQAGTSTVFLVFQRQTDFISARSREVRARADLAEAFATLERATARTLEAHQISMANP
ncbi:MAG: hypothetical protein C5B51_22385 [Terriglobia bacterium]|nr:MAG: hypothetical protein C5B51_22385 [Terriglobia bacterium]